MKQLDVLRALEPTFGFVDALWIRDGAHCRYCGRELARVPGWKWEMDHVIPVCQDGAGSLDNMVLACRRCNRRKGGRTPGQAGMPLRAAPVGAR